MTKQTKEYRNNFEYNVIFIELCIFKTTQL